MKTTALLWQKQMKKALVHSEEINKVIEKGKGKPDFIKAEDKMADANNLAAAMVLAPIAGLAAAARKAYNNVKKTRNESNESTRQIT